MSTATEHRTHSEHSHVHGEGCGHVAFPHDDHIDYLHDGHIHRVHEGHVDECGASGHVVHEADQHEHQHGHGCGHVAVPHDDHVDYLHDGHRHASHEGHWDDH
ncbi:hypothetical protein [Actinomadura sp. 6N118]|uniref:hypothetical protein n=1 Tax=Actinomadura sp. 6N118 TaxID=3375151 RepID=UPI00378C6422